MLCVIKYLVCIAFKTPTMSGLQYTMDDLCFKDSKLALKTEIVGNKNPMPMFLSPCSISKALVTDFIIFTYSFMYDSSSCLKYGIFSSSNNFRIAFVFLKQTNDASNGKIPCVPSASMEVCSSYIHLG